MPGCDRRCPCMHIAGGPEDIPAIVPEPRPYTAADFVGVTIPEPRPYLPGEPAVMAHYRVGEKPPHHHHRQAAPVHPPGTDFTKPLGQVPSMIRPDVRAVAYTRKLPSDGRWFGRATAALLGFGAGIVLALSVLHDFVR